MGREVYNKLHEELLARLQRELYPHGYPKDITEKEFVLVLETWLAKHAENEAIQKLWDDIIIEHVIGLVEEALTSKKGQAAGFRSFMRPNADGTLKRLWAMQAATGESVPKPDPSDLARN